MYSLRWGTIFEAGVYISWFWSPASRGNWKWKRTAASQTYFISHYQTHWNGSFDKLYLPSSLITSRKWLFSKVLGLDCPVWVLLTPACEMISTAEAWKNPANKELSGLRNYFLFIRDRWHFKQRITLLWLTFRENTDVSSLKRQKPPMKSLVERSKSSLSATITSANDPTHE